MLGEILDARRSAKCRDILSIAAFEIASGFVGTAREHLANAERCSATGCCASPLLCGAAAAPPPPPGAAVVPLPPRPAAASSCAGSGAAVVPLRYASAVEQDEGGNRLERRTGALERLGTSRRLSLLLEYWRELWLASRGTLADFDPVRLVQMSAVGWVHLFDVGDADPAKFSMTIRGWRVPDGGVSQSREGMQLGDYPIRLIASGVMADYLAARQAETPLYHCIRSRLNGNDYAYRRLILPLSTDGRRTDRLLVATDFGHQLSAVGSRASAAVRPLPVRKAEG